MGTSPVMITTTTTPTTPRATKSTEARTTAWVFRFTSAIPETQTEVYMFYVLPTIISVLVVGFFVAMIMVFRQSRLNKDGNERCCLFQIHNNDPEVEFEAEAAAFEEQLKATGAFDEEAGKVAGAAADDEEIPPDITHEDV